MSTRPLLLFDGECSLCSSAVQFVLRHERDQELQFAPLQSAVAQRLLSEHGLDPAALDTLVVLADGRALVRSDAALELARHMGPWRLLRGRPRATATAGLASSKRAGCRAQRTASGSWIWAQKSPEAGGP
jgi:predicted DCC family thiol-disulfide oxidoreductase YuxK